MNKSIEGIIKKKLEDGFMLYLIKEIAPEKYIHISHQKKLFKDIAKSIASDLKKEYKVKPEYIDPSLHLMPYVSGSLPPLEVRFRVPDEYAECVLQVGIISSGKLREVK